MEEKTRFKDSSEFELAMRDLLGKRYYGSAGGFSDFSFCKRCLLSAIRRIRKRLNEIVTMDERLGHTSSSVLDNLERESMRISTKANNDWAIIANLLHLVSYLLGYDWQDGKTHRNVIFYQDKAQQQTDWLIDKGKKREYLDAFRLEEKHRFMLVNLLNSKNIPEYQIAELLGISIEKVRKTLKFIQKYENEKGEKFPTL